MNEYAVSMLLPSTEILLVASMFWNVETLHLPGRQGRCGPVQPWQQSSGQQPGLSSSLLISLHSFAEPESSAAREPWSSTCGK